MAPRAALVVAILVGAALLAVTTTARGASHRAQAAAFNITQSCSGRVEPGTKIQVQAVVQNQGDENLHIDAIDADAGTPDNTTDDFTLTYVSGDTNGDRYLSPTEEWHYNGEYTAPREDVTNIVGVDVTSVPGGTTLSDLAPCETDVIQQPAVGQIAGVKSVSGKVMIKKAGSTKFVELAGSTEIPVGSQVDTTKGTVLLTEGLGGGKTGASQFYDGLFTILQKKAKGSLMTLRLGGGRFGNCTLRSKALSIQAKSKRPVRRLWGSGKGKFTTRGRYSAATVRGTKWLTLDRCDGTLTKVLKGIVRVQDFRAHKTVNVPAGHQYLARAPG
ncbi:MAG: hypothetical protein ABI896_08675 [Actinomycetota bacterium]